MNSDQLTAFYPLTLAVRRLFHKIGHAVAELHRDAEISVGMRAVLESVINGGPQTVPAMARIRPVTRQHIQGLVNALLDAGYVEMRDNPAHKRSKLVAATLRGEALFRKLRKTENAAFRKARIKPTPQELEAAERVITSLIDTLDGPEWAAVLEHSSDKSEPGADD